MRCSASADYRPARQTELHLFSPQYSTLVQTKQFSQSAGQTRIYYCTSNGLPALGAAKRCVCGEATNAIFCLVTTAPPLGW
jgi:hypothetical protein